MSVTSEIQRIQNAKASIKTAIENKGVSVGDGLLDTYPQSIESIITSEDAEELNVTPTEETQNFVGLYNEVNVDKINTEEKTTELDFSNTDVIEITPNENRYLKKVTINKDEDLVAENIKSGVDIFGVEGSFEGGGGSTPEGEYSSLYQDASPDSYISVTSSDMYPYFAQDITEIGDYKTGKAGARNLFSHMNNLRKIGRLDTSLGITSCYQMFRSCWSLEYINLEDIQSENVTNMSYMFYACKALKELDLSKLNTENVTNMSYMMSYLEVENIDLNKLNTKNVTNMNYMVSSCKNIEEFDLSKLDTSNVTSMTGLFSSCSSLKRINLAGINTNKLTNIANLFTSCSALTDFDISDFVCENVTNMSSMFSNCNELTSVDISGIDASKCTNVSSIFSNCRKLTTINYMTNVGKGFTQKTNNYGNYAQTFNYSPLTHDCIVDIANKLYDLNLTYNVAGGGTLYTQRIYLGNDNIAKLSSEELAIFTNKGYTVM